MLEKWKIRLAEVCTDLSLLAVYSIFCIFEADFKIRKMKKWSIFLPIFFFPIFVRTLKYGNMIRISNISFFRFCWKNGKLDWPKCARTQVTSGNQSQDLSDWQPRTDRLCVPIPGTSFLHNKLELIQNFGAFTRTCFFNTFNSPRSIY